MSESNMLENLEVMRNPWRDLVTPQFKAFLDSLSNDSRSNQTDSEDSEL